MSARTKTTKVRPHDPQPANRNAVALVALPDEAPARTVARCLSDPATRAAGTINMLYRGVSAEGDVNGYIAELQHQARTANAGDLSRSEAMLSTQANTLDALFHTLIGWALNHVKEGGNPAYFETCMRLGFKAQSQSRATIETLSEIKNPRQVAFVKQANIAGGHQQVNNGMQPSGAREIETQPTELLEQQYGERLDTGAASATGRANQTMETVGTVNGAADRAG